MFGHHRRQLGGRRTHHREVGQAAEEVALVRLLREAVVEDDHHAVVCLRSDEAPEPLAEAQHRLRQVEAAEPVDTVFLRRLAACLEEDVLAWDRQLGVNLRSVYLVSHHVVPVMLAQGAGAIVNNASVAGLVGDHAAAAYCAGKGGVALLTKQMALDYAARGVRVNAICCGEIDTPLFVRESAQLGMTPDEYRAILNEAHPMGRIGLPSEAAAAVAFLAGDDASFITGVLLPVDGGYMAQ